MPSSTATPTTVEIDSDVLIDVVALIVHLEERVLVLNGNSETAENLQLGEQAERFADLFFGSDSSWKRYADELPPLWAEINRRARTLTEAWMSDLVGTVFTMNRGRDV